MTALMLTMRLIHIVGAAFWVGAFLFTVVYLEPSVRAAGPDGASVMKGIQQRGFMNVLPVIAILTILSGAVLMWQISAGFNGVWMGSRIGVTYSVGALAALIAAFFGMGLMRPRMMHAGRLAATLPSLDDAEKQQTQQQIQTLRDQARGYSRVVAVMLIVAIVTMAIARYVPAV